jgi:hypothetical protein
MLSAAPAAASGVNATVQGEIHVNGKANDTNVIPIAVSTPELSNVYSIDLANQLPTGRVMESVALLSSSVRYDDQTTGLVQMGAPVRQRAAITTTNLTPLMGCKMDASAL